MSSIPSPAEKGLETFSPFHRWNSLGMEYFLTPVPGAEEQGMEPEQSTPAWFIPARKDCEP